MLALAYAAYIPGGEFQRENTMSGGKFAFDSRYSSTERKAGCFAMKGIQMPRGTLLAFS